MAAHDIQSGKVILSQSILLRGARQLLTLRGKPGVRRGAHSGNLEIIEDGSVFIQGGKIVSVGPTRRLENLKDVRGAIEIHAHNCIVMPGFVDASIQLNLAGLTSGGTPSKRRRLGDFFDDSVNLMRSCLQHGTLNAGIKAYAGVHSLGADLSLLRQVARIGNNPVGMTRIWCPERGRPDTQARDPKVLAGILETVSKRDLADSIQLQDTLDHESGDPILKAATMAGMQLSLDWSGGTSDDLKESLERSSPASVFCHHGLSGGEQKILAGSNTTAVFSAGGALWDSKPGESARDLIEAGGAVALGSGYDAQSEPNFNMQLVLALAVRRLNMTIEQAIVATTINAAHAMNCGDKIGSLEPGKRAEVLVLNLSDYREIPRRLGVNHVAMAIRDGNIAINRTRRKVGAA